MSRRGFSLLEVILSLTVVALIMAAVGPALVGALRAQRQAHGILDPLANEQAALAQLREDLAAAPRPNGSLGIACTVATAQVKSWRGDTLSFLTNGAPPLHPTVAVRAPEAGQAVITWAAQEAADGRGLSWTRSRQANVFATGTPPDPVPEVMLDHLASLTVEVLSNGAWLAAFSSADQAGCLPPALRVTFSYLLADDSAGPVHVVIFDLPQMALDPTQQLSAQGLRPYGPSGLPPGFVEARFRRQARRNRGRMGFAHFIRPPPLGARPIAARRGPA